MDGEKQVPQTTAPVPEVRSGYTGKYTNPVAGPGGDGCDWPPMTMLMCLCCGRVLLADPVVRYNPQGGPGRYLHMLNVWNFGLLLAYTLPVVIYGELEREAWGDMLISDELMRDGETAIEENFRPECRPKIAWTVCPGCTVPAHPEAED